MVCERAAGYLYRKNTEYFCAVIKINLYYCSHFYEMYTYEITQISIHNACLT